ncbi:acyl-CoA thioester hydrolase YciA [Legionella sp. km772]|uniref:acyl-CoA thioester hydrolase YciA n=1 Tax=Legionella sp. km772 TaxID=2498111 RepID=UPI000F8EFBC6|nr:acyl-CoA thioester hydrolase YciA [Legionella sp. km772]RUR13817.1 acyl-CoA thioester hydrolase YciA [Legionella sp. km772]
MAKKPQGELTIQTLAMPMDTNANGDIFGGWIVSQMDLAVGILAKKISKGRIVTVAINSMTFLRPVHVGDVVSCYAELVKVGNTSMTVNVEVWAMPADQHEQYQVTEGVFVSVAIDEHGLPRQVPKSA